MNIYVKLALCLIAGFLFGVFAPLPLVVGCAVVATLVVWTIALVQWTRE